MGSIHYMHANSTSAATAARVMPGLHVIQPQIAQLLDPSAN